jgi:hypothetical protein
MLTIDRQGFVDKLLGANKTVIWDTNLKIGCLVGSALYFMGIPEDQIESTYFHVHGTYRFVVTKKEPVLLPEEVRKVLSKMEDQFFWDHVRFQDEQLKIDTVKALLDTGFVTEKAAT